MTQQQTTFEFSWNFRRFYIYDNGAYWPVCEVGRVNPDPTASDPTDGDELPYWEFMALGPDFRAAYDACYKAANAALVVQGALAAGTAAKDKP